jgi:hypothetical protein
MGNPDHRVAIVSYPMLVLAACSAADAGQWTPPPSIQQVTPPAIVAPISDSPAAVRILVVNEVSAGADPDWFEVVNASPAPVHLDQFVYVDAEGDLTRAARFPAIVLGPGAYHTQDVDRATSGFKLGSDEELWIYRAADHRLSDGVDWVEGEAMAGVSYARWPDVVGEFTSTVSPTKGAVNL